MHHRTCGLVCTDALSASPSPSSSLSRTCRLVTQEGGALVERQTKALFGDPKALQRQMQEAVGKDIASLDDLMERVQKVGVLYGGQVLKAGPGLTIRARGARFAVCLIMRWCNEVEVRASPPTTPLSCLTTHRR